MPRSTAPGVRFETVDASSDRIAALRTDVAAFVGVCERGPLAAPVRAGSWEQFRAAFGNLAPSAFLPWSVKAFFENGGRTCWITRVAAPPLSTSATQPDRTTAIVADATGFTAGAVATLTQTTTIAAHASDRTKAIVAGASGFGSGAAVTLSQTAQTTSQAIQPADRLSSAVMSVEGFRPGVRVTITQGTLAMQIATETLVSAVDATTKTLAWDAPLDAAYDLNQLLVFETTLRQVRRIATIDSTTSDSTTSNGTTIHWSGSIDEHFDLAQPIDLETTARSERLIAEVAGTTITWTRPIGGEYDLTRPIDVATGACAASGVLLDLHGLPAVRVEASSPGAWGNAIRVFVSRTSRHATRTAGVQTSGAFSVVESVTGITPGTILRIFQDGVQPFHRVVASVDPARRRIDWTVALANVDLTRPFSLESDDTVIDAPPGTIRILGTPALLATAELRLTGGRDGTAALRVDDVLGGLKALELVDEVSFVAIPDVLIERVPALEVLTETPPAPDPCAIPPVPRLLVAEPPPPVIREQSATFDLDDVLRVQNAMVAHCEKLRDRMALLDPPNFRPTERGEIETWRRRFDTKYAALYFPWITVLDPQNPRALTRDLPPSGHVAGIWARSDLAVGVHKAPANEELRWAQDVTIDVAEGFHELLNPRGINAIRRFPARGLRVYGARTVSSDPLWRYVNVRRLLIMIEEALEEALQWSVFEPHDLALRDKVALSIFAFLERLWEQGALAGATAGEAFFIRCNESNNPPDAVANGRFLAEVGVAPVIPAEFVVFRIGRTEDVLETTEEGEN